MADVETLHLAPSDEKLQNTQDLLKDYDFIRFTSTDINGVTRGCVIPVDHAAKVLKSGMSCFSGLMALHPIMESSLPKKIHDEHIGNALMVADVDTLHAVPWVGGHRVGQFMTEMYWNPTSPQEACPRYMARRMLGKLNDMGLEFYSGYEVEYLLLNHETQVPVFPGTCFMSMERAAEYEPWFYAVASNIKKANVYVATMHTELNPGQFEITTQPELGIKSADGALKMKQGIKEMAKHWGWQANFMAVAFPDDHTSGANSAWGNFNFSVWHKMSGKNAFWDEKVHDKVFEFGKHWIAGMIHHAKALTAICNSTINCYRALHTLAGANQANWGTEDRTAMIRVKNDSSKGTYFENRLPSSLSNPYLVMAATIAAGLDGVVRKLPCPTEYDTTNAAMLPYSLNEALDCLQDDTFLVEALGEEFVEWFVHIKREVDLKIIDGVTVDAELFELEKKQYWHMM